jgi:hypothetical protein
MTFQDSRRHESRANCLNKLAFLCMTALLEYQTLNGTCDTRIASLQTLLTYYVHSERPKIIHGTLLHCYIATMGRTDWQAL